MIPNEIIIINDGLAYYTYNYRRFRDIEGNKFNLVSLYIICHEDGEYKKGSQLSIDSSGPICAPLASQSVVEIPVDHPKEERAKTKSHRNQKVQEKYRCMLFDTIHRNTCETACTRSFVDLQILQFIS